MLGLLASTRIKDTVMHAGFHALQGLDIPTCLLPLQIVPQKGM